MKNEISLEDSGDKTSTKPIELDFIDVKKLIETLTDEELLESANNYWDSMSLGSEQCYKPFSNHTDPIYLTRHLSMLFQAAGLFPGARVLDFGCATGWLTLGLAEMGMKSSGVDISPKAIQLAEGLRLQRGLRPNSEVDFKVYNGHDLPYEDASFDRILCFDAFHHVRDQEATLKEMARILCPGGRIAMLEPGPGHSKAPMSQYEMRNFKVIENDIDMIEISDMCRKIGLIPPKMLLQLNEPIILPVEIYKTWTSPPYSPAVTKTMFDHLQYSWVGAQCFFLDKPLWNVDSRKSENLAGEIKLLSSSSNIGDSSEYTFKFQLKNTGKGVWLANINQLGQVNLGIQLIGKSGKLKDKNIKRINLPSGDVQPGEIVLITVIVKLPDGMLLDDGFRFELVAEEVSWFGGGNKAMSLDWYRDGVSAEKQNSKTIYLSDILNRVKKYSQKLVKK